MSRVPASGSPVVDACKLLELSAESLDTKALGQLVAIISDWQFGHSRAAAQRLIERSGLTDLLFDAEFVEGVGRSRLKTRRLLALAFATADPESPATAIRKVEALMAAGALNIYSSSAVEALHAGMSAWRGLSPSSSPIIQGEMLARVAGELDTRAQAGLFLALFFGSPANAMDDDEARAVFRAVRSHRDVRDLAGERGDLLAQFPPDLRSLLVGEGEEEGGEDEGEEDDEDASDADSQGNLADFIAYSDEDDEEEDEEGPDSDEDDDESSGRDESSRDERPARPPTKHGGQKRGRLKRTASRRDSSGSDEEEKEASSGRRRGASAPSGKGRRAASKPAPSKRRRYVDDEAGMGSRTGDE